MSSHYLFVRKENRNHILTGEKSYIPDPDNPNAFIESATPSLKWPAIQGGIPADHALFISNPGHNKLHGNRLGKMLSPSEQTEFHVPLYSKAMVDAIMKTPVANLYQPVLLEAYVEQFEDSINVHYRSHFERPVKLEKDVAQLVRNYLGNDSLEDKQKSEQLQKALEVCGVNFTERQFNNLVAAYNDDPDHFAEHFEYSKGAGNTLRSFEEHMQEKRQVNIASADIAYYSSRFITTHNTEKAYQMVSAVIDNHVKHAPNSVADIMGTMGYLRHYLDDQTMPGMGQTYYTALMENQMKFYFDGPSETLAIQLANIAKQHDIDRFAGSLNYRDNHQHNRNNATECFSALNEVYQHQSLPAAVLMAGRLFAQVDHERLAASLAHESSLTYIQEGRKNSERELAARFAPKIS